MGMEAKRMVAQMTKSCDSWCHWSMFTFQLGTYNNIAAMGNDLCVRIIHTYIDIYYVYVKYIYIISVCLHVYIFIRTWYPSAMFLVQLDSFNSELWNIAIGFALHKRAVASSPSSGSLWFLDRDWKIVCSNNHKSNNPPLLLVEAASFDASLPSLQHRPCHELWILAGWKTTFTFFHELWWTILRVFDGIWFLVGCCSAMFRPFLAHMAQTIADHQPSAAAFIFAIAKVPACKDHGAGYQIY